PRSRCTRRARHRQGGRSPRIPPERARSSSRAPLRRARGRPRPRLGADRSAEGALQLLEEALVVAISALVARCVEFLEQAALLVGEVARNGDVDEYAVIAMAEALQHRHALATQDAHLARLNAGCELELDRSVERLDGDRRADGGLHDRQVDLRVDVVALANETWIGLDMHQHVDVARAPSERACVTLAGEADALPVMDAGRNVDRHLAALDDAPGPVAVAARVLDDLAASVALRARVRADELSEHAARHL